MGFSKTFASAALAAAALIGGLASAAPTPGGAREALAAEELDLASMLVWAIQDEREALVRYAVVVERFGGERPFSSILRAEDAHIRSLTDLAAGYGIAVPAEPEVRPEAPADLEAATEAGLQAAIDNTAMYDRFLRQDLPADVRLLFLQLKAASQNRLRAFATSRGRWR